MLICPMLTNCARLRNYNTHLLDLGIVRTCLIVLFFSFFTAFEVTSGVWLLIAMFGMCLGEGLEPALQGIVTWINDPAHYPQLFTTLAIVDTISDLIGGPLTAILVSVGRTDNTASAGILFSGLRPDVSILGNIFRLHQLQELKWLSWLQVIVLSHIWQDGYQAQQA